MVMKNYTPERLLLTLCDYKWHSFPSFVDNPELADSLQTLQKWGVELDKATLPDNQYQLRLSSQMNLLDSELLNSRLKHEKIALFYDIDSTNDFLLKNTQFTLCSAERQNAGRGRRGRIWHSPFAQNLYISLRESLHLSQPEQLPALSLVVALALVERLTLLGVEGLSIKWPNDSYLHGRKLGGILIDAAGSNLHQQQDVVIGFGLNLAMQNVSVDEIEQPWSSLTQNGIHFDRSLLLIELVNAVRLSVQQLIENGLSKVLNIWQKYDSFYKKEVSLFMDGKVVSGIAEGVEPTTGELLLNVDGEIQRFSIGEISLRAV